MRRGIGELHDSTDGSNSPKNFVKDHGTSVDGQMLHEPTHQEPVTSGKGGIPVTMQDCAQPP